MSFLLSLLVELCVERRCARRDEGGAVELLRDEVIGVALRGVAPDREGVDKGFRGEVVTEANLVDRRVNGGGSGGKCS